jgi:hypothetical protein
MNAIRSSALAAAAALVLGGCATLGPPHAPRQYVRVTLDPAEWTQVLHAGDGAVSVTEYAAPGETAERWTRFASVQVYSDAALPYPGARPALSECRALLQATCPGAVWTVLRDGDQDALYEWRVAGCPAEPDQHEVGRVMHGRGTWARVSFSTKGEMDAATRERWIRQLEAARLVAAAP